jgi:TRAP-type C4-dicarboxylate transport system substrate-binding protein
VTVVKIGALFALALASAAVAGCASTPSAGDKAGGTGGEPVVLRMSNTPYNLNDVPLVRDFVRRVAALSGGKVRIKVLNQWGNYAPDAEAEVVRAVASGRLDLGWAGSRVFDSMGVSSFRALSAPMLIDSYPLENAVLQSTIPAQMLAGLQGVHVTGLGVLGDGLRLPISVRRPLLTPADWRGLSIGTYRSQTQEQAIRALGATPVVAYGPYRSHDLDTGAIQGFEFDVRRYERNGLATRARYVAANVPLWPQIDVVFANPGRLASLTDEQRGWLLQAAEELAKSSVRLTSRDVAYIRQVCAMGARFVNATPADLAALRSSLSDVYRELERDPQTKGFVQRIERLKKSVPPAAGLPAPVGCRGKP